MKYNFYARLLDDGNCDIIDEPAQLSSNEPSLGKACAAFLIPKDTVQIIIWREKNTK